MDVRFYDMNFNLVHIEPAFKSVNWEIRFNKTGTFEMFVTHTSGLVTVAFENRYLIAVQGEKQAIITTKRFEEQCLVLYGRTLNFLLSKRVVFPFSAAFFENRDGIAVVKTLVEQYFPEAEFESEVESVGECDLSTDTPQELSKTVIDILEKYGLGHSLYFDAANKKWIFRVIRGEERGLFFSEALLNMYSYEREESLIDYVDGGYYYQPIEYMGEWNAYYNEPYLQESPENFGKSYKVTVAGEMFGLYFRPGDYIFCKNREGKFTFGDGTEKGFYYYLGEKGEGICHRETFFITNSYEKAEKELEELQTGKSVTAKVKGVKYGRDYRLGDVVTLSKKIAGNIVTEKMKITGVTAWFENANEGEMPVFSEYKEEK